jgi:hypothetical protein
MREAGRAIGTMRRVTFASLIRRKPRAGQRALSAALGAHVLHDGYTDLLYVLLPV